MRWLIAILIRPNLVPLAAALALWMVWRDRAAAWPQRVSRLLAFGLPASLGAIGVAIVNARLCGSPFASGYGDLSDAYSWSYVVPNVERYGEWLLTVETPLAAAGLASLFVPWGRLWPTSEARRARGLLAVVAVAAWISYLLYVPWDAWWYSAVPGARVAGDDDRRGVVDRGGAGGPERAAPRA